MILKLFTLLGFFSSLLFNVSMATDVKHVDVFLYDGDRSYFQTFKKTLVDVAKEDSFHFTFHDANKNSKEQFSQLEKSGSTSDGIIIHCSNVTVANKAIEIAKAQNIPLVFFNRLPMKDFYKKYDNAWFVGHDARQTGFRLGKLVKDYLDTHKDIDKNHNKKIDFVMLGGTKENLVTQNNNNAFLKYILNSEYVLNPLSGNFDTYDEQTAYLDTKNQIAKYGIDNIELIVSDSDNMALGAIRALNEIGYNTENSDNSKRVPVFGVNGIKEAIDSINKGMLTGTVFTDFASLARACVKIMKNEYNDESNLFEAIKLPVKDHSTYIPTFRYAKFKEYHDYDYIDTDIYKEETSFLQI